MKQLSKLIGVFILTFFLTHEIVILSDGLTDDNANFDVGVIFGNTVNRDGSLSPRLKARLDKGIELFNQQKVDRLFVSGGLGKEGHYEGTKMAEYLILNNIPDTTIIIDNSGNNTRATAENFKRTFPHVSSVVVVTQYHHVLRAKLAFRQIGINEVGSAHANYWEMRDFYSCFREFFAYYAYLIRYS